MGERRNDSEQFFHGKDDPFGIFPQEIQGRRVFPEIGQRGGAGMDDRVASAGKSQNGKPHHLVPGERPATEFGLVQRAKKVVAGVFRGAIQHGVEIGFQSGSLVFAFLATEENIEIPTNPGGNLFFRDIEKNGQRPALKWDGQIIHRLDGITIQRLREQAVQQRLDPGHDTRVFGAEKKRLHDLPILRVFRRVGLQRNLPHGSQIFL